MSSSVLRCVAMHIDSVVNPPPPPPSPTHTPFAPAEFVWYPELNPGVGVLSAVQVAQWVVLRHLSGSAGSRQAGPTPSAHRLAEGGWGSLDVW